MWEVISEVIMEGIIYFNFAHCGTVCRNSNFLFDLLIIFFQIATSAAKKVGSLCSC